MDRAKFYNGLSETIEARHAQLKEKIKEHNPEGMADLCGEDIVFFTEKGNMIRKREDHLGFWRQVMGPGSNLTLKTVNVLVTAVKASQVIPNETCDHVAIEIGEYSVSRNPNSTSGTYISFARHIDGCDWDRRR